MAPVQGGDKWYYVNKEGFETIRKIHESKGGRHEELSSEFEIVGTYLKEYGYKVQRLEELNQTVFVAEK